MHVNAVTVVTPERTSQKPLIFLEGQEQSQRFRYSQSYCFIKLFFKCLIVATGIDNNNHTTNFCFVDLFFFFLFVILSESFFAYKTQVICVFALTQVHIRISILTKFVLLQGIYQDFTSSNCYRSNRLVLVSVPSIDKFPNEITCISRLPYLSENM